MTISAITLLGKANPDAIGKREWSRTAQQGRGVACEARQCHFSATAGEEKSVEPKLSRSFCHFTLNSVYIELGQGNVRVPTTSGSSGGYSALGMMGRETCPWQGVSIDDLSTINDCYAAPTCLNKVDKKSNMTSVPEAS